MLEDAIEAEKEGDMISKRTSAAMQAAKRRGIQFGVACKELAQRNKQAANDFAQKMKPLTDELIAQGFKSSRALAAEMNHRHIPTFRRHRAKWHRNSVCNLLHRIKALSIDSETSSFTETSTPYSC